MAIKKGSSIIESSKIQGGTSVKILAQSTDGVDILVGAILGECPNAAARKLEELDAKLCTSQEKVDNALSIFLIAPSYLPKPAEPSFLAPCQLP